MIIGHGGLTVLRELAIIYLMGGEFTDRAAPRFRARYTAEVVRRHGNRRREGRP